MVNAARVTEWWGACLGAGRIRAVLAAVGLACCLASGAEEGAAKEAETGAGNIQKQIEALEARIEEMQERREALERRAEEAERTEELRREVEEIQRHIREMMEEQAVHLKEIEQEQPETENRRKHLAELKTHLLACREVGQQILALKGGEDIGKARALMRKREELETHWWMVMEPRYDFAIIMEDMLRHAREVGATRLLRIIDQLERLHGQDKAERQKEFEMWQARQRRQVEMQKLMETFWGPPARVEPDEEAEEAEEAGEDKE